MGAVLQILLGSGMLAYCALVQVAVIAYSIPLFPKLSRKVPRDARPRLRIVAFLGLSVFVLVFTHTVQIWTWAVLFLSITDLPDLVTSFYFATVTYTTLGYGDIVLDADARIVATFCTISGLLTFGISTAFLIGVLSRILPHAFEQSGE